MIVVVAGEQREYEPSPQFAQIARNIMAELPDAVRQHRVSTSLARRQTKETRRRNKRHTILPRTVKPRDDSYALFADRHALMLSNANASLLSEPERENLPRANIPRIIRFRKFRNGQSLVWQANHRFGPRAAQRRASTQKKSKRYGGYLLCRRAGSRLEWRE